MVMIGGGGGGGGHLQWRTVFGKVGLVWTRHIDVDLVVVVVMMRRG